VPGVLPTDPQGEAMIASAVTRLGDRFRRSSGVVVLLLALAAMGGIYTAAAPSSQAADTPAAENAVEDGQRLYNDGGCVSCHGRNAQGIEGRGPSLIGVGSASVEFQVGTGRMPMARQEAQAQRKPTRYKPEEIKALGQYIQSLGGGPQIPEGNLRDGDIDEGGRLFRVSCAQCHGFSARGGALSSGKYAPSLEPATDRQIYAAMLSGPQNMPVFGDNQLTPDEKKAIIKYVQSLKAEPDPGGMGIGRTGPVPEGLVVFVVGLVVLLFATLWIAGKS
jgi:ubiquinol-cytochrome c reductase cytochrome c subunit